MAKKVKDEDKPEDKPEDKAEVVESVASKKQDETVPGGDFIVDGRHVDADGKEIGKK